MINQREILESGSYPMNKKKIAIIAALLAVILIGGIGIFVYSQGDHVGPEVKLVDSYTANYGERIGLFDLVRAVSDEGEYSIKITSGGTISEDGRSTVFSKAATETVEITAVDELGHKTVKTVTVVVADAKPPMLSANDITISLGDAVDYHTGVTAHDEMDGNLTSQIQVDTSLINEAKAGIYPIIYTVKDKSGNESTVRTALTIKSPEPEAITLSQQSISLEGNGHYQLVASVDPRAWNGKIQWSSSNDKVAVVTNGLVTWVGSGSCTVTATAGEVSAACQVRCGNVTVSGITLDLGILELEYKQSETLLPKIVPSNWSGEVVWTSSDTTIATVDEGVVTWAGQGECVITASADGAVATCQVSCAEPEIELIDIYEDTIHLKANASYTIFPVILPEDWPGEIAWSSSDTTVATVVNGVVKWIGPGTCEITATAGELEDTCVIVCEEQGIIGDIIDSITGGDSQTQKED